jgi:hypothetical protein
MTLKPHDSRVLALVDDLIEVVEACDGDIEEFDRLSMADVLVASPLVRAPTDGRSA